MKVKYLSKVEATKNESDMLSEVEATKNESEMFVWSRGYKE